MVKLEAELITAELGYTINILAILERAGSRKLSQRDFIESPL